MTIFFNHYRKKVATNLDVALPGDIHIKVFVVYLRPNTANGSPNNNYLYTTNY